MQTHQYMSIRDSEELSNAMQDLDSFLLDSMSNEQTRPKVTWDDIEIEEELPTIVVEDMSFKTACSVLDEYANRESVKKSVIEARKLEARSTDINCFDLKPKFNNAELNKLFKINKPRITSVIDWLRLEIVIGDGYSFRRPSKPYEDIKDFLKIQGVCDNPYVVQSKTYRRTFTIDMHDVLSGAEYDNVLNLLRVEYQPASLKIVTLEVALDFYNIKAKSFMLALAKSIRVDKRFTNTDLRTYKHDGLPMPIRSEIAMKYAHDCYSIGIGHKNEDDLYVRIYYKMTDRNQMLPFDQHRMRIEINVRGTTLDELGNDASNIKHLVNESFKLFKFTHLIDDASAELTADYRNCMGIFGKEISIISKSRNKRNHPDHIESYAGLNKVISKVVSNFIRKF